MLSDFFRINLPYGFAKNEKNEWMAFNREYMPLGYNDENYKRLPGNSYMDLPVYTSYKNISESLLIELAHHKEGGIQRDDEGNIKKVFLYNDQTNPVNQSKDNQVLWNEYFEKIKKLSKLKIKNS